MSATNYMKRMRRFLARLSGAAAGIAVATVGSTFLFLKPGPQMARAATMTAPAIKSTRRTDMNFPALDAEAPAIETPAPAQEHSEEQRLAALRAVREMQLSAILSDADGPACIIDGAAYRSGQMINGCRIAQIGRRTVTVERGSYRFELDVQP